MTTSNYVHLKPESEVLWKKIWRLEMGGWSTKLVVTAPGGDHTITFYGTKEQLEEISRRRSE